MIGWILSGTDSLQPVRGVRTDPVTSVVSTLMLIGTVTSVLKLSSMFIHITNTAQQYRK